MQVGASECDEPVNTLDQGCELPRCALVSAHPSKSMCDWLRRGGPLFLGGQRCRSLHRTAPPSSWPSSWRWSYRPLSELTFMLDRLTAGSGLLLADRDRQRADRHHTAGADQPRRAVSRCCAWENAFLEHLTFLVLLRSPRQRGDR